MDQLENKVPSEPMDVLSAATAASQDADAIALLKKKIEHSLSEREADAHQQMLNAYARDTEMRQRAGVLPDGDAVWYKPTVQLEYLKFINTAFWPRLQYLLNENEKYPLPAVEGHFRPTVNTYFACTGISVIAENSAFVPMAMFELTAVYTSRSQQRPTELVHVIKLKGTIMGDDPDRVLLDFAVEHSVGDGGVMPVERHDLHHLRHGAESIIDELNVQYRQQRWENWQRPNGHLYESNAGSYPVIGGGGGGAYGGFCVGSPHDTLTGKCKA